MSIEIEGPVDDGEAIAWLCRHLSGMDMDLRKSLPRGTSQDPVIWLGYWTWFRYTNRLGGTKYKLPGYADKDDTQYFGLSGSRYWDTRFYANGNTLVYLEYDGTGWFVRYSGPEDHFWADAVRRLGLE